MRRLVDALATANALRRLALASIIANVGIIVTGGAVRLTGSGLGCPTWPRCTDDSYVTTPEMGFNGVIEFGNRLLTFVVGAVALVGLISALLHKPRRPGTVKWSALVLAGIPAQGVVGGFTVLTNLNPYVVGCHFLVSVGIVAAAYMFWTAAGGGPKVGGWAAPGALRALGWSVVAASLLVVVLGVVVTGSGPHAGDADARRTGLDIEAVSQLHADAVFLLIGLSVGLWLAVRAAGGPARAAAVLVAVELAQGFVGFAQYLTHLPELLVGLHMFGACLVWVATLAAFTTVSAPRAAAVEGPGGGPFTLPETLTRTPRGQRDPAPGGDANDLLGLSR
ncbi:cytochrome b561 [Virgisporangium aliadipatigenens]|uniref:Cytochrome b561 n=1 Tax=Virgisporangium aliadipatigenens TaxID=741659 RepID=A0A8J4DS35_9ACTN|nr:COX15/CtaA family protein [Virgisporangium aliadipatigenens]GIJ47428.1 cytochrome b561 [Virgisporangium aliadipatigenens]